MQVARINTPTEEYLISIEPEIDVVTDGFVRVIAVEDAVALLTTDQYMIIEWASGLPIPKPQTKH